MTSARAGLLLALVVAGVPLYQLVATGRLDLTNAVLRIAFVAAVCGYGVTLLVRLALRYEEEAEAERKRQLEELFTDMEDAVAEGVLTDPDLPAPPTRPLDLP